jgi:hypothetical protein
VVGVDVGGTLVAVGVGVSVGDGVNVRVGVLSAVTVSLPGTAASAVAVAA